MVIVINYSERNFQAAGLLVEKKVAAEIQEAYGTLNLKAFTGKRLILLDLNADAELQEILSGAAMADKLYQAGLPDTVRYIDIYMSDVSTKYRLSQFGQELVEHFWLKYKCALTAYSVSEPRFDYTLLVPAGKTQENWQVLGIQQKDMQQEMPINFDTLSGAAKKTLLWEGADLLKWMAQEPRIYQPLEIKYAKYSKPT